MSLLEMFCDSKSTSTISKVLLVLSVNEDMAASSRPGDSKFGETSIEKMSYSVL